MTNSQPPYRPGLHPDRGQSPYGPSGPPGPPGPPGADSPSSAGPPGPAEAPTTAEGPTRSGPPALVMTLAALCLLLAGVAAWGWLRPTGDSASLEPGTLPAAVGSWHRAPEMTNKDMSPSLQAHDRRMYASATHAWMGYSLYRLGDDVAVVQVVHRSIPPSPMMSNSTFRSSITVHTDTTVCTSTTTIDEDTGRATGRAQPQTCVTDDRGWTVWVYNPTGFSTPTPAITTARLRALSEGVAEQL